MLLRLFIVDYPKKQINLDSPLVAQRPEHPLTNIELAVELQAGVSFRGGLPGLFGELVHLQAGLLDIPLCSDPVPLVIIEWTRRPDMDLHRAISNIKRKGDICCS